MAWRSYSVMDKGNGTQEKEKEEMNLKQLVINKVNEIGLDAAEEFFGKKKTTIQTWLKNATIPLDAAQKVLQSEPAAERCAGENLPPDTKFETGLHEELEDVWSKLGQLNQRVAQLESNAKASQDSGAPAVATGPGYGFQAPTPPIAQVPPNAAPTITSTNVAAPAPVVASSDAPAPYLPSGRDWARPHKFVTQRI